MPSNSVIWLPISHALLWILLLSQSAIILALLRQVGILSLRIGPAGARLAEDGPDLDSLVPALDLVDIDHEGARLVIPAPHVGISLIVFISPKCQICDNLMIGFRTLSRQVLNVSWAIVAFSEVSECREFRRRHQLRDVLFCHAEDAVWDKFKLRSTPFALVLDAQGRVLSKGLVNHIEHLESLVTAVEHPIPDSLGVRS